MGPEREARHCDEAVAGPHQTEVDRPRIQAVEQRTSCESHKSHLEIRATSSMNRCQVIKN